jgi:hypothetical protein
VQVKPLSDNLSALLTSFRDTGGIERLMDYLFYQVAAINGFDSYGHYLRAQLIVNTCTTYRVQPDVSCSANFQKSGARAATAAGRDDSIRSPALVREDKVMSGESVAQVLGLTGTSPDSSKRSSTTGANSPIALPPALLPGGGSQTSSSAPAASGSTPSPAPAPSSSPAPHQDPAGALLDYLLGGGS